MRTSSSTTRIITVSASFIDLPLLSVTFGSEHYVPGWMRDA